MSAGGFRDRAANEVAKLLELFLEGDQDLNSVLFLAPWGAAGPLSDLFSPVLGATQVRAMFRFFTVPTPTS